MAFSPRFRNLSRLHVETLELPQDGAEERQMRRGADQLLRRALHADHAWWSHVWLVKHGGPALWESNKWQWEIP